MAAPNVSPRAPIAKRSPLRVLMVIPGEERDKGVMIFARREAAALEREGIDVRIFFLTTRTEPLGLARAFRALTAEVARWRPDIVHAQFGTVTGLLCTLLRGTRVVVCFRGSDLNPYFRDWSRNLRLHFVKHALARAFSQLAARRADGIVCVSDQLRSRLRPREQRIALINPASIHTALFAPVPRDYARRELGWDARERIVLFAANRTPAIKRPELARAAVTVAATHLEHVRMVTLDGRVAPDGIPLYLNAADVLLLTSDYEGSPTIVAEAISCNLPVVSVDVGDVSQRLEGVHPSAIVDRSPEALGAALVEILRTPTRSNGRLIAERYLDDRYQARRLIDYYHLLLSSPERAQAPS